MDRSPAAACGTYDLHTRGNTETTTSMRVRWTARVAYSSVRGVDDCIPPSSFPASSQVGPRVFDGITTTFGVDEWCGARGRAAY